MDNPRNYKAAIQNFDRAMKLIIFILVNEDSQLPVIYQHSSDAFVSLGIKSELEHELTVFFCQSNRAYVDGVYLL